MTEEENDEIIPTGEEAAEETPETPIEPPCDPVTMNCDEMRDTIISLTEQRVKYDDAVKKLDDVKNILQSEEINEAYNDAITKKKDIDHQIYGIFEKFTVCTNKPKPPDEEKAPLE